MLFPVTVIAVAFSLASPPSNFVFCLLINMWFMVCYLVFHVKLLLEAKYKMLTVIWSSVSAVSVISFASLLTFTLFYPYSVYQMLQRDPSVDFCNFLSLEALPLLSCVVCFFISP